MNLGVVNEETWRFFEPIYEEFRRHHLTAVFQSRRLNFPLLESRINRYRSQRALSTFLRAHDLVFFEWASGLLAKASQLEKTCGIVTRLHRYELYQWADRINWDHVDKVILVSRAKKREFSLRFPKQAGKVVVIPEAIDPTEFPFDPKPYSGDLGILCHLSPRKRVYELILAFSLLAREDEKYHLHIGGGPHSRFPEYERILKSLVKRMKLERRITFYGPVQDAAGWYRNIDIFISNSYSEGLQVSPMEAMAAGSYCLSHWWDGAEELLPEAQLFFNDDELVRKIREYEDISAKRKLALQTKQKQRVETHFNVHSTKEDIRNLVEEAALARAF